MSARSATVVTRPAMPADLPALGRLGALLVRLHHSFDARRFVAPRSNLEELYGAYLGERSAEPNVVVLVAERDGVVLGYTYAGVEGADYMALRGPAGVLYDIVVDPAARGQGVGQTLLEATLTALRARSAPRVVLMTAEQNTPAQRLFERAGFRPTMIEMTRELDADAA